MILLVLNVVSLFLLFKRRLKDLPGQTHLDSCFSRLKPVNKVGVCVRRVLNKINTHIDKFLTSSRHTFMPERFVSF